MAIPAPHLGWMAGVIDTKGRIRRVDTPHRKNTQLVLQVQTRHPGIVERLCGLTGTKSQQYGAKAQIWERKGCGKHCPEAHIHIDQTLPATSVWHITGAGAAIVLYNLLPYLTSDKEQEKLLRDVYDWLPGEGKRGWHAVKQVIDRLAELGWQIPPQLIKRELEESTAA